MSKKISQNCIDLVKEFEGCSLTAYKDEVGVWTIGYGITNSDKAITGTTIKSGLKITQATAEKWLEESLTQLYLPKVTKYDSKYDWNQNELDALTSFAYNLGSIDGLTADGTRSRSTIASKMLEYNKAGGEVLKGLTRRREAEQKLFLTPVETVAMPVDEPVDTSIPDCTDQRDPNKAYFKILKNQKVKGITKMLHNRGFGGGTYNKKLIARDNAEADDLKAAMLDLANSGKLVKPTGLKKQNGKIFTTSKTKYFSKNKSAKSITAFLHNRGFGAGGPNLKKIAKANCNTSDMKAAMLLLAKKGLLVKPKNLRRKKS